MIRLRDAAAFLHNVEIAQMSARTNSPFCVGLRANLTITGSRLYSLFSKEQGLIHMTDSTVTFKETTIQRYNVTFLYLTRSYLVIENSYVIEGGLKLMDPLTKSKVTAGFVDCEDSQIYLIGTHFKELSGTHGGVVSLKQQSNILIEQCLFENCLALKDGGAIRANFSNVSISGSTFHNNTADRGACLYFECLNPSHCQSEVTFSHFTNNSAREGAVVKWTLVHPYFSNNTSAYNRAVYGEFEASVPTHIVLANSNDSAMTGVPGVVVVEPILIAFMDHINQLVATDHSSIAIIQSDQIIGTTYVMAKDGIANFSGVIFQTTPGTTVSTTVFSPTINSTFPNSPDSTYSFDYHTRLCLPGEISSDTGCYLCPKNTFSVEPQESDCRECPGYATCPGGSALLLDQGYWRLSELSSAVYTCPIPSACLGGQNSTCAEGYADRLCSRCTEGYYSAGLSYCLQCESLPIRVVRISLFSAVLLIIYLILIRKSTAANPSSTSISSLATLKILFNFLQSILMISLINVDWRSVMMGLFSANEMFVSLALSAFTIECFPRK